MQPVHTQLPIIWNKKRSRPDIVRQKIKKARNGNSLEGINAEDAFDKQAYISHVSAKKKN